MFLHYLLRIYDFTLQSMYNYTFTITLMTLSQKVIFG